MRDKPTTHDLHDALARFDALLRQPRKESDLQKLFSDHPYILSRALPLRLEPTDIRPLGRPGKSEPDFVIFPATPRSAQSYGVIEIKRPDSRILKTPRKGVVMLSDGARTAVAQAEVYLQGLHRDVVRSSEHLVVLGNNSYTFVIMGLTSELANKIGEDVYRQQLDGLLPRNCQLIPYDTLFKWFHSSVPPRFFVLTPAVALTDVQQLIKYVDGSLDWWKQFQLTEDALAFWRQIEERTNLFTGSYERDIRPEAFFLATGGLATETDNPLVLAGQILSLLRRVNGLALEFGIDSKIESFMSTSKMLLDRSRSPFSDRQRGLLSQGIDYCSRTGQSTDCFEPRDEDVQGLVKLGVLRLVNVDSGEAYYSIHPLTRFGI